MSQTTLTDEDLFGEAASEIRADVAADLDATRAAMPTGDSIWEAEADNVLGVLNGLKSTLQAEEARDRLRDAKKWFVMGERADAFEDAEDLGNEIETLESLLEDLTTAQESVGELTRLLPELRSTLDSFETDEE